jgi:hypothetical protein
MRRAMTYRRLLFPGFALLMLALSVLACNLTGDDRPPTIIPRASPTPQPTIGYATPAPDELPDDATLIAPQQRTDAALVGVLGQVAPDNLFVHVQALQSTFTRHVNSPQNDPSYGIGAAAAYITQQFAIIRDQSGGRFVLLEPHRFNFEWANLENTGSNIIGVLQGTDPDAGILLLGAHYDSITRQYEDAAAHAPGANDNASGLAALLEIARIMSQRPHKASIMFVAFGAEEIQRRGSTAFVQDYLVPNNIKIDAMLNMDIIGSSTGPDGQIVDDRMRLYSVAPNDSPSRQLAREINLIGSRLNPTMAIEMQDAGDREGRYSDHLSFSDAGYAAVRFIEYLENPNRNHNDADTIDAVRSSYLVKTTQSVLAVATALADGPRPPRSISLRENGDGTRTLVWETTPDAVSYVVALRAPGSIAYNYYFDVPSNSVTWDGFVASRWESIAIGALDGSGLMGPLSNEFIITN